ncbi:MAG: two-component system response regulator [Desulfobacteraceae bacterium]|nr:two-component system response regulator [Desulfobacteraceae bacterium]
MTNSKWKVLVVDDEPNNLQLLGQILQDYQLSFATDGTKALDVAWKVKPDIILLDIMMPEMDGYETCRRLKADPETSKIPVIFVTAMEKMEDEYRGFEVGGVDYITKPVSAPIVLARVRTHLALYDQNRLLEEVVQQRTKQLRQAFQKIETYSLDSIYRLTRASEYKDEDTGAHIQRMSHYSAAVARKMGLGENVIKSILYGAPMHDVGKIGIPDRILLKPGKLDAEEWEIMRQHTTFGGKILEGSKAGYLKLGEVIALTHHEKWDGSGYPKGLKGKEIPKVGRIVAIADVFDALTTKRPYKEPFPLDKSYRIIREGLGSHFDPDVVDAFFAVEDEILEIKEKYKDERESLLVKIVGKAPD